MSCDPAAGAITFQPALYGAVFTCKGWQPVTLQDGPSGTGSGRLANVAITRNVQLPSTLIRFDLFVSIRDINIIMVYPFD